MVNLCQLGTGCFGCCGRDYTCKEDILNHIKKNMLEHANSSDPVKFMDRQKGLHSSGVCRNIGFKDDKLVCLVHPKVIGREIRKKHCDHDYLCKTMKVFLKWDKEQQDRFIAFIEEKHFEWYEYSIKIDDDSLLKEFTQQQLLLK